MATPRTMHGAGYTSVSCFASGGSYSVNSLISNDSGCCLLNWHSGTGLHLFHCDSTVSQAGCQGPLLSENADVETESKKRPNTTDVVPGRVTRSQHVATKYLSIWAGQLQMFSHSQQKYSPSCELYLGKLRRSKNLFRFFQDFGSFQKM